MVLQLLVLIWLIGVLYCMYLAVPNNYWPLFGIVLAAITAALPVVRARLTMSAMALLDQPDKKERIEFLTSWDGRIIIIRGVAIALICLMIGVLIL